MGELLEAHRLAPDDPRPLNAMAVALLTKRDTAHPDDAVKLFDRAHTMSASYLPAAANLAWLFERSGRGAAAERYRDALRVRCEGVLEWPDVDGALLPTGFDERNVGHAATLAEAVRAGHPGRVARFLLERSTPVAVDQTIRVSPTG